MPVAIEKYVDIAAAVVVAIFLGWLYHRIIQKGRDEVTAANAKVVAAQQVHNDEVNKAVATRLDVAMAAYRKQLAGPVLAPIHVSVCNITPSAKPIAANEPAPKGGDGSNVVPSAVGPVRDIGPATDQLLTEADARIKLLQDYITNCIAQRICRAQ